MFAPTYFPEVYFADPFFPQIPDTGVAAIPFSEGFEGAGFENLWVETGTPTGTDYYDEDATPPTGSPVILGSHSFRAVHSEGDLSVYAYIEFTALAAGYLRFYLYPVAYTGEKGILNLYSSASSPCLLVSVSATEIGFWRYVGGTYVTERSPITLGEWICVEFGWDRSVGWTEGRVNATQIYRTSETLDNIPAKIYIGNMGTGWTYEHYLDAIAIRSDDWPGTLLPTFLPSTHDVWYAPKRETWRSP